jgi:hypothetical protein
MQRRRESHRTRGPYGESIYSAGREEYRGSNKRHPGLHGHPDEEYYGNDFYNQDSQYPDSDDHFYEREGYEYRRSSPQDNYYRENYYDNHDRNRNQGGNSYERNIPGMHDGERSFHNRPARHRRLNNGQQRQEERGQGNNRRPRRNPDQQQNFSSRGYGFHFKGHNESEHYGRQKEAAFYDEEGPERMQNYRGRGYLTRAHEGEYDHGIMENFGTRQGFGRYNNDDERDYSNHNYRNMPSGW